jgi:ketohexokinase
MAGILCVGIATLDIVNQVEHYPEEDSEVRALAQRVRLGGNAANTAIVLAQLGDAASWVGNLGEGPEAQPVRDSFARYGVDASQARVVSGGHMPTSYITLSRETGSRSIVHFRDLPEYSAEAFSALDLRSFDWVHFEGRAVDQLAPMLERARGMCGLPVSLEVEKPRDGIEALFESADLLMFSRHYVSACGFAEPRGFLESLPAGLMATCTWGEQGVWARDFEGRTLHAEAHRPARVVDTLGAGDVFNAGLLHAITRGVAMERAVHQANRLAGEQCGREGLGL